MFCRRIEVCIARQRCATPRCCNGNVIAVRHGSRRSGPATFAATRRRAFRSRRSVLETLCASIMPGELPALAACAWRRRWRAQRRQHAYNAVLNRFFKTWSVAFSTELREQRVNAAA